LHECALPEALDAATLAARKSRKDDGLACDLAVDLPNERLADGSGSTPVASRSDHLNEFQISALA
jgi:hypothetical protein